MLIRPISILQLVLHWFIINRQFPSSEKVPLRQLQQSATLFLLLYDRIVRLLFYFVHVQFYLRTRMAGNELLRRLLNGKITLRIFGLLRVHAVGRYRILEHFIDFVLY